MTRLCGVPTQKQTSQFGRPTDTVAAAMAVRVKICGLTSEADARAAVEAGADALGFMFYEPSPRHVPLSVAAEIIHGLPPMVAKAGVFVNASARFIHEAVATCGLDTIQLHGEEPAEFCQLFRPRLKVVKAFRIRDAASLSNLSAYVEACDALLLDSHVDGQKGGTGTAFNWQLAVEAKAAGLPIILAGGLTPDNAAEAVRRVRPFGVDVSSGVESSPGRKDASKMGAFIRAVRSGADGN
jgi:phosphoribosylanthranilate isomerase